MAFSRRRPVSDSGDANHVILVGGTGIEPVALPCETEVGCLQINDMRVEFPIATGT